MKHKNAIICFGLIWFSVGVSLLSVGLNLLTQATKSPILKVLSPYTGGVEEGVVLFSALALLIGIIKGKYILRKTATRMISHIRSLANPAPISQIFNKSYLLLIASMMGLGMLIKYLGIPNEIRGVIDIAIGSALIHGSTSYFKNVLVEHYL